MNEPHMAPWWFPANDHPRDRARMDIHVTVPRGHGGGRQRAARVPHGPRAARDDALAAEEPMAPYLAFFAAGHFAVRQGRTAACRGTSRCRGGLPAPRAAAR